MLYSPREIINYSWMLMYFCSFFMKFVNRLPRECKYVHQMELKYLDFYRIEWSTQMKVSQDVVTVPSLLCVCECMSFFLFLFFSLSQPPSHTFIYPHCLQLSHTPIPPSHTSCHVHSLQTLTSTSLITLPFKIHVPLQSSCLYFPLTHTS